MKRIAVSKGLFFLGNNYPNSEGGPADQAAGDDQLTRMTFSEGVTTMSFHMDISPTESF